MQLNSIYRVFCKGLVRELLPKVQEVARKLGLDNKAVALDANRKETRVDCNIKDGKIIPVVPGFMPQVINYGMPAREGTAAVVIDVRQEGKLETRVFRPQNSFLFLRNGMVFNLWERLLEVFYLGAEKKEENGEMCWHPVYKPMFQCSVPSYIMSDLQMREYLQDKLKGKVPDSHLRALNELTLNPVQQEKKQFDRRDKAPNNGVDISGKSQDGLPGVSVAQSEPGDELGGDETADNANSGANGGKKVTKAKDKNDHKGEGKPNGKPKSEGKGKSNSQLTADAKAGVTDAVA
jgi:hypothetical protein